MARSSRFLSTVVNSPSTDMPVAEPPEAVTMESDFVVILAALLCALICVVGLILVARCAWLRRGSVANGRRIAGQTSANKGIKKKFVDALPKFSYDSDSVKEHNLSAVECAICLAEYAVGDEIRLLPQCGHGFHVGCIDVWLGSHSSCPSCREILVITRCRKCGDFPTDSVGQIAPAAEVKGRQINIGSSSNEFLP
ncbi:RING-H2 finger protein ATL8 [Lactuca sativa]|uniref:RING-H2 finger protein ATL8 n=1 Tax=Lactuca sativa TaxID=4236 RepID=UPI000CB094B5|nr:RING-H2 finger protein ATL8 [Lactuca sativa]